MTTFQTIAEVRAANRAADLHFFDRHTMNYFHSRIESKLYGGRYFITSEADYYLSTFPRRYTVRRANDDGSIDTVGDFQAYATIDEARYAAKDAALREAQS